MVGSWDNHAYLYAIEFGRVLDRVPAHDDAVVAVALQGSRPWLSSPVYRGTNSYAAARRQLHDGLLALTGSWDSTVKVGAAVGTRGGKRTAHLPHRPPPPPSPLHVRSQLWQLRSTGLSREPLRSVCEHDVEVRAVDLSPCGRLAVSASEAGAIAVHDVRAKTSSGDVVQRAESSVTAVQWDCEGRAFVACTEKGSLMHCSIDGTVLTQLDARGASTCDAPHRAPFPAPRWPAPALTPTPPPPCAPQRTGDRRPLCGHGGRRQPGQAVGPGPREVRRHARSARAAAGSPHYQPQHCGGLPRRERGLLHGPRRSVGVRERRASVGRWTPMVVPAAPVLATHRAATAGATHCHSVAVSHDADQCNAARLPHQRSGDPKWAQVLREPVFLS